MTQDLSITYLEQAKTYLEQKLFQEVIETYQKAIELEADCWQAYHHWGDLLLDLQRNQEAIEKYHQAIAINPHFSWSYHNLGLAYQNLESWQEAIDSFHHTIELDPNFATAYFYLAEILSKQEQWDEAIFFTQKAIEVQSDYWQAYHHWGDLLLDLQRNQEAIEKYQQAIAINPHFSWSYHNLGIAYQNLELWQKAIDSFQRTIELDSHFTTAYFHLAEIYVQQEQWNEAIVAYHSTLQLQPNFPYLHQKIAYVFDRRSQLDAENAVNSYLLAIKSGDENIPQLYLNLIDLLVRQNKFDLALFWYQIALQSCQNFYEDTIFKQKIAELRTQFYQSSQKFSAIPDTYSQWRQKNTPNLVELRQMCSKVEHLANQLIFTIILLVDRTEEIFLSEVIRSILEQVYPYWELSIVQNISSLNNLESNLDRNLTKDSRIKNFYFENQADITLALNNSLQQAKGEFIALLKPQTILTPDALFEFALILNTFPQADLIYSDEDCLNSDRILCQPWFKPDWCPDSFLSRNYLANLAIYRRTLIDRLGGFRVGFEDAIEYDISLRFTEQTNQIFHIAKILHHNWIQKIPEHHQQAIQKAIADALIRRGEPGKIIKSDRTDNVYLIRYQIQADKLVSIIIPTKNLGKLLDRCLNSIFNLTTYPNYEIILIDNGSDESETLKIIDRWQNKYCDRLQCYRLDILFNYSRLNNYAVDRAKGDYLLFLNNDTEIITPDWLDAMVEQAQRPSIGAVGALLLYPNHTIQHAGVVMGLTGIAGHIFRNLTMNNAINNYQISAINNYSAVTAACLMCRRKFFTEVNGFEESLAVAYNDIDLCLKIQQKGYHNIYLPHVILYHHESQSRGQEDTPDKQERIQQEVNYMQKKWQKNINQDLLYNINLSKEDEKFSLNLL